MVAAGATRVGASAGVKIVQESKGRSPRRTVGLLTLGPRRGIGTHLPVGAEPG